MNLSHASLKADLFQFFIVGLFIRMRATACARASAVVFCGQGSHRKGMGMMYVGAPGTSSARVWNAASDTMMQRYHICLGNLITENPAYVDIASDAFVNAVLATSLDSSSQSAVPESNRALRRVWSRGDAGAMQQTFFAQPAMLAAQLVMFEHVRRETAATQDIQCYAGHSLGEFTALAAAGVFPVDVAVDLVFRRGVLMQNALDTVTSLSTKHEFLMYACNPTRAQLSALVGRASDTASEVTATDMFCAIVEQIGRALQHTTSFVELVNANVEGEQYVVAGDAFALSVLGKTLDPQFRTNDVKAATAQNVAQLVAAAVASVGEDIADKVTMQPNKEPSPDFVPGMSKRYSKIERFKRQLRGPDDGRTLSLDDLTHLTLEQDGRSGLKKKSWFMPLSVSTPFHSSLLRRAMDEFYPLVRQALPSDEVLRRVLATGEDAGASSKAPKWVCNLTGRVFDCGAAFRAACEDSLTSMNIGEVTHHGKYQSRDVTMNMVNVVKTSSSPRELVAVALAAQMAHPVQWTTSMETIVQTLGVRQVVEIAPTSTVSEMFRRSKFRDECTNEVLDVTATCLPEQRPGK